MKLTWKNIKKYSKLTNLTKVWLTKSGGCIVANNNSKIPEKELSEILEAISNNFFFIVSMCKKHFPSYELKFYC